VHSLPQSEEESWMIQRVDPNMSESYLLRHSDGIPESFWKVIQRYARQVVFVVGNCSAKWYEGSPAVAQSRVFDSEVRRLNNPRLKVGIISMDLKQTRWRFVTRFGDAFGVRLGALLGPLLSKVKITTRHCQSQSK
jgi:hypothetical protein